MNFELHPNLKTKAFILDIPLCSVLLENENHYPWLILVPRRAQASRIIDLSLDDQIQLTKELQWAQEILWNEFHPTQLNVAAIGNKTPQLHVHVIARYQSDPAWPGTVWDHPVRARYADHDKEKLIELLKSKFNLIAQATQKA